jgi:hypothetical protein
MHVLLEISNSLPMFDCIIIMIISHMYIKWAISLLQIVVFWDTLCNYHMITRVPSNAGKLQSYCRFQTINYGLHYRSTKFSFNLDSMFSVLWCLQPASLKSNISINHVLHQLEHFRTAKTFCRSLNCC